MTDPTPEAVLSEREALNMISELKRHIAVDSDLHERAEAFLELAARAALAGRPAVVGAEPVSREHFLAIREGHHNAAEAEYFDARPGLDTADRRRVFYAGFCKGYDAAPLPSAEQAGAEPSSAVKASPEPKVGELMKMIDAYAFGYPYGNTPGVRRDELKAAITNAIGFEWLEGEMQTVNASDLLRVAAAAKAEQAGAVVAWTEDHTMRAINATASFETVRLTSEHGPYDISRPTFKCDRLVEAVIAIRDAQWRNSLVPQPVAANVPMVCAIEINRQGQPYPRTCGLCGLGPCKEPR